MVKRKRTGPQGGGGHVKKSLAEAQEIKQLQSKIQEGAPPPKTNVLSAGDQAPINGTSWATAKRFEELPLSQYTKVLHAPCRQGPSVPQVTHVQAPDPWSWSAG